MTREEKCKLAIEKGYTYNPETGDIYNRFGKILKNICKDGYIRMSINLGNKKIISLYAHHFSWYCVYNNCDTEQIDHINRIRDDNRILNLRSVTRNQNMWNKNDVKGYFFNKNKQKYQVQIMMNGKKKCIGHFNTKEEARNAYLEAKQKYHVI